MFNFIKFVWLGYENIAKINPKMAKKQPFFDFFDFYKNCPYDSNEILYSPSTLYYGPLCVICKLFGITVALTIRKIAPLPLN